MKYAMTFLVDLYDFEEGTGEQLTTRPGDYIRAKEWMDGQYGDRDDAITNLRGNYALAWCALKREGRLGDFGAPDELDDAAIAAMADRLSVHVSMAEADSLPLSGAPAR